MRPLRLLLVLDDASSNMSQVTATVSRIDADLTTLDRARLAESTGVVRGVDAVLLSGDGDSIEACRILRSEPVTSVIPIVVLGDGDPSPLFEAGATDVVEAGDVEPITARIRHAVRHRAIIESLEAQASIDPGTGIANAPSFRRALAHAIGRLDPSVSECCALILCDLDDPSCMLQHVRGSGRGDAKHGDVVTHLEDGVVAILVNELTDRDVAKRVAERLSQESTEDGAAAAGYCILSRPTTMHTALRAARTALEASRGADGALQSERVGPATAPSDLTRDRLALAYQPIVDLRTSRMVGFEGLLRYRANDGTLQTAEAWIDGSRSQNELLEHARWTLEGACRTAMELGVAETAPYVSVNVSLWELREPTLAELVGDVIRDTGLDPSRLWLEVDERALLIDPHCAVSVLPQLAETGARIAIDGVGRGDGSPRQLAGLPLAAIKIDRSIIATGEVTGGLTGLLPSFMCLAYRLGIDLIACGIETSEDLARLQGLDCDFGQGFHLASPMPSEELIGLPRAA